MWTGCQECGSPRQRDTTVLRRGGAEPALTSIQHERRTLDRGRLSLLPASISKPTRTDIAKRALRTTTSIVSNVTGVSPHASPKLRARTQRNPDATRCELLLPLLFHNIRTVVVDPGQGETVFSLYLIRVAHRRKRESERTAVEAQEGGKSYRSVRFLWAT